MSRAALSLLLALTAPPARAADPAAVAPVASFALTEGWVDFVLTRDGKPVPDARVTVLVGAQVWARGETGVTGSGTFPRPAGTDCQMVFDLGAGPSAPVPLTFPPDGTVAPTRAPVLDGTAECCAPLSRRTRAPEPQPIPPAQPVGRATPLRDRLVIGAVVAAVSSVWLAVVWRRSRRD